MINKQNSELENLIENVGLEELTERHISNYFTESVKGGNTEAQENKREFIDDLHREINPVIDELKLRETPELANFSTELKSLLEEIKKS